MRWAIVFVLLFPWGSSLAATFHVNAAHPNATDAGPGTAQRPFRTLAKAAQVARAGDEVIVHAGVYREEVRVKNSGAPGRPIVFRAAAGERVVLTGADVLEDWRREPGDKPIFSHRPWRYRFMTHPNDERHKLVGRCEQVIVDGKLLRQVLSRAEMAPGTFCADTEQRALYVWLADGSDPREHLVEASTRTVIFCAEGEGRDYICVRGFIFRFCANPAQHGALFARGNHWVVEDNVFEWTNGAGLSFRGRGHVIRNNICRNNGQLGMGGGGAELVLEGNQLLYNNVKGFNPGWEAGGMKITHSEGGIVRRMVAVGNRGPGLWFDIDDRNFLVEQCLARDNEGSGIFVEISRDFVLRDNLCVGNGGGRKGSWANSGILIAESPGCLVEHNVCVDNRTGIGIREQGPRKLRSIEGAEIEYYVRDCTIRDNICAFNVVFQFGLWSDNIFFGPHPCPGVGSRGVPLDPDKNNIRLEHNLYFPGPGQGLILWGCPWRKKHEVFQQLADFARAHGQDTTSRVADPQFVDWEQGDFRLRPTSPAIAMGVGLTRPAAQMSAVVAP